MAQFTKKPVTIEAFRWTGDTDGPVWLLEALKAGRVTREKVLGPDQELAIHTLEGVMTARPGDWIIQGLKGELYPCRNDIFQASYVEAAPARDMTFGQALESLKAGARIARDGWNGKAMWLSLSGSLHGRAIGAEDFWSANNAAWARHLGGIATVLPCITMKTATGEILMGWLASQSDMLSSDWMVVA